MRPGSFRRVRWATPGAAFPGASGNAAASPGAGRRGRPYFQGAVGRGAEAVVPSHGNRRGCVGTTKGCMDGGIGPGTVSRRPGGSWSSPPAVTGRDGAWGRRFLRSLP